MSKKNTIGRLFMFFGALVIVALFSWEVFGQEINIIEVRRSIPLSDDEKIYKDYYISGGADAGLKTNMVVTAQRKVTVKDASGTQTYGEMLVPVGQLKIIFVSNKVAIAREQKVLSFDEKPWMENIGFMNGDKIEMK
jgi:hypothetical protein